MASRINNYSTTSLISYFFYLRYFMLTVNVGNSNSLKIFTVPTCVLILLLKGNKFCLRDIAILIIVKIILKSASYNLYRHFRIKRGKNVCAILYFGLICLSGEWFE